MGPKLILVLVSTALITVFLKKHLDNVKIEHQRQMDYMKEHIENVYKEHKKEIGDLTVQHKKEIGDLTVEIKQIVKTSNLECENRADSNLHKLQTYVVDIVNKTIQAEVRNGTGKLLQDIKVLDMELYSSLGIAKCLPCSSEDPDCIPCNMTWRNCADVYKTGHTKSGVYRIKAGNLPDPVSVYCEASDGGGWLVFQRRRDNAVSFERKWHDYKTGFGNVRGSHWLGNDVLAAITSEKESYMLRIDLINFNMEKRYAEYDSFKVRPENEHYKLLIGNYRGNAGDNGYGLSYHNGIEFSTVDKDHDRHSKNCAESYHGGWWYKTCHYVNLNGLYSDKRIGSPIYMTWYAWDTYHSLKNSEMKLRPTYYMNNQ